MPLILTVSNRDLTLVTEVIKKYFNLALKWQFCRSEKRSRSPQMYRSWKSLKTSGLLLQKEKLKPSSSAMEFQPFKKNYWCVPFFSGGTFALSSDGQISNISTIHYLKKKYLKNSLFNLAYYLSYG